MHLQYSRRFVLSSNTFEYRTLYFFFLYDLIPIMELNDDVYHIDQLKLEFLLIQFNKLSN